MVATPTPTQGDTVALGEYLAVFRRRKWSIVGLTLLGILAAGLYERQQTPIYQSNARVRATSPLLNPSGQEAEPPNMETESAFVASDVVTKCASVLMDDRAFVEAPTEAIPDLDAVCSRDSLAETELDRSLSQKVTTAIVPQANVMSIGFTDPIPVRAQAGSQAFALAYIHTRTLDATDLLDRLRQPLLDEQKSLSDQESKLEDQIDKINGDIEEAEQNGEPTGALENTYRDRFGELEGVRGELDDVDNALQNLDPSKINPPQLLLPAGLPANPISPGIILLALLGLVAGLAFGVVLAFIRERLDDSLRGRTDLEIHAGVPALAVIPKVPGWRNKREARLISREQPKSAVAEAYRTLRTSIQFAASQREMKAIMVCSPGSGDGKTTTAANLSLMLADAGRRVVLVSSDLRKPRIHQFFGLEDRVGLSNILAGDVQLWESILDPGIENLRLVLSGPVPARPAELLQSTQMGEVLSGLREVADYVILDTAPILLVADALALAPLVDGVLLVADSDRTSRGAVAHAREQLEQVGAVVFGAALNNFDPAKARAYRYAGYYPYQYGYLRYGYGTATYAGAAENGEAARRQQVPPALELPQERGNP
jgi:capsular exopolysaccharide synthesis family protein